MFWKRVCLAGILLLASVGLAQAQEARTISGRVLEASTNEPIPGAAILVVGTDIAAISEADGTFVLEEVPAGPVKLLITSPGYSNQEIEMGASDSQIDVAMSLSRSEEILIIGRAPQITRQNLANGASVVKGEDVNQVPAQTLDNALQGRISGANIQANSGAPGGGIQIKLRGVSTINGDSSPLFVVDGVIVSNASINSGISAITASNSGSNPQPQDNPVNRIADLNPGDIENIEILKGPAAAALYGSKATNGVVIITTKRGRAGEVKANITQRFGVNVASNTLGSRTFESMEEAVEAFGPAAAQYFELGRTYDHEKYLTNQVELATETAASVRGGSETGNYYASALLRDEPGVISNTGYEKQSLRLNVNQGLGKRLRIALTSNLIHSNSSRSVTNNDNANISHYMTLPSTPSFWDPRSEEEGNCAMFPANPFIGGGNNPVQTAECMSDDEEVWRLLGSASANLRAWENATQSVNVGTTFGFDRFQQQNKILFPEVLTYVSPIDGAESAALEATTEIRNLNFSLNTVYNLRPASGAFQAATTVGFQYEDFDSNSIYLVGRNLNPEQVNVNAAASVVASEERERTKDQGIHIQQEFRLLDDRLTLLGAVLAESSSRNGDEDKLYFFPKIASTYSIPVPDERIELLRARLAYGETGNKPLYGVRYTELDTTQFIDGEGVAIGSNTLGDEDIEPERQREIEGGIDLIALDGRVVFELSLYRRKIDELILRRALAPSAGYLFEFGNFGALRNRGIEFMLQGTPVQTKDFDWVSRATFSLNRSRITDLSIPAFDAGGFGTGLGAFRIERNKSATQIVGDTPNGIRVLGDAEPDFRMSFVNNFNYGDFELTTLLDWQQGSDVINLTRLLFDGAQNSADYDSAGRERITRWADGDASVYIEDASFLKVREVSLSYRVPESILSYAGPLENARISLSGRNLLTFTPYSGLDPEVSNFGAETIARNIDVAPYPPSRSFWFSIDAGF